MASALALFTVGATFAYFVMPVGLTFLAGFLGSDVTFLLDLGIYMSFFLILVAVFGVAFELPVVVLLAMLGIVSSGALRHRRKVIYFGIILVSLVITPGG